MYATCTAGTSNSFSQPSSCKHQLW